MVPISCGAIYLTGGSAADQWHLRWKVNADDLTWSYNVKLQPGVNNVPVVAVKDGKNYPAPSQKILYETEGPKLVLELPEEKDGKYYVDDADFLLQGTVTTR